MHEAREEAGLAVKVGEPFHAFQFRRGKAREQAVGITFQATSATGGVRLSREHSAHEWVPLGRLREADVPPSVRLCFESLLRKIGRGTPISRRM